MTGDSNATKGNCHQVEKYVREILFRVVKFTTDINTLYQKGGIYIAMVRDLKLNNNMGEEHWKKLESVVRRSFNNKRNNTVETMKLAFKRK